MSSACSDHPCDRCPRCEAGECCGADVIDANLPEQGSWPAPAHAPVGEIRTTEDGRLVCHVCGEAFHGLYRHLTAHNLTAEEYRAYFGLKVTEPLASETMREARRLLTPEATEENAERLAQWRQAFTAEQRSAWSRNRVQRIGARGVGTRDGEQARRASVGVAGREANPEAKEAWKGRIRARRKRRDPDTGYAPVITCIVCGAQFSILSTHARPVSPRKTCGTPECVKAVRRKAQAAGQAAKKKPETHPEEK